MIFLHRTYLAIALLFVSCASSSRGAEPAAEVEVVRLAITPASEPLPALKYQLLPTFLDRRPGNAALDYGRAMLAYKPHDELEAGFVNWLKLPPREFDAAAKEHDLAKYRNPAIMSLLRLAARCERCDWQPPLRDQDPFSVLLPECQQMRTLARLTVVEARLKLAEGRFDEAIKLLSVGYAMARHIADEPTLVNGLVGLSITAMNDQLLLDLMQRPGAPSLYWALTFLPQPLIDRRLGLEAEMYAIHLMFPVLRDDVERTPEEWNAAVVKFLNELPELAKLSGDDAPAGIGLGTMLNTTAILAKTALRRDDIKSFLIRCGQDEKRVAKMGDTQLLVVYTRLKYEELRDRQFRQILLPYAESRQAMEAAETQFKQAMVDREEILPLAGLLLPAITRVSESYAIAERRHDALRILEALRLYAGKHEGDLPKALTEVTGLPMPKIDPITGKPYDYLLDGDTARLTLPEENRGVKKSLVYEITIAK